MIGFRKFCEKLRLTEAPQIDVYRTKEQHKHNEKVHTDWLRDIDTKHLKIVMKRK